MDRETGLFNNTSEFVIEWIKGETHAFITVPTKTRLKSKILALADKYPDEVEIVKINPDGSMYTKVPTHYIVVRHPKVMSEEAKLAARDRLLKARKQKKVEENERN